jgi:hypothetical protein
MAQSTRKRRPPRSDRAFQKLIVRGRDQQRRNGKQHHRRRGGDAEQQDSPAAARQLVRAFSDVFPFDSAIPVLSGDIAAAGALLPWTALPPAGRAVAFEVDVTALGCASLLACAHAVAEAAAPNVIASKPATSALFIRISLWGPELPGVMAARSPL